MRIPSRNRTPTAHPAAGCHFLSFFSFFPPEKLRWLLHFFHVLFLISDFCIALCNFLFTVLRSIKQFLNIFQLHPWLHGFSVNSISKIYSCRILMVKFGQQIFGQFPKLFLHRMVIIRQTTERNFFFSTSRKIYSGQSTSCSVFRRNSAISSITWRNPFKIISRSSPAVYAVRKKMPATALK